MRRRTLLKAMGALGAAVGLAFAPAAQAQFAAAAPQAPDGLRVTFCGTSGPLPVRDRAKACVAIQAGDSLYLVDVGPEATENLMMWRLPLNQAKALFLTHLHSDHIGEVGEFNLQSWVAGRPAPLLLVGPAGTEKVAQGFNLAYATDHGFRKAHHEHGAFKFDLKSGELQPKVIQMPKPSASGLATAVAYKDGDLTVTAIKVAHEPVEPAFAYRFDYKGRSVVVSGDTRKWPPLAEAAKGADVLIHEAQNADMTRQLAQGLKALGNPRMSSLMTDTLTYHTTPVEAADIARSAGVKRLVLYHLTQAGLPMYNPEAFTRGMDAGGALDWRLAKDGMTIDLPAGGDEIRFGQD
ncbi:MBL fold metallo-hydrolase [Phenylobacterium soli]|uniref:MBL fold metallo-hydrolase n=1 Tax=Phenylobacterium soli TaxID=2170551 RepID=A0A328AJY9_9CAUL|nr:MBL fold metallo-hydrolase [Phenylobacterium soli]RAK54817.1 MBL fold metallo-hydrolase [Phenylobacterium soli]